MKLHSLIPVIGSASAIAFAGEPTPAPSAPAPAPTLGGWFVGGGFGQISTDSNLDDVANRVDPDGYGFEFLADGGDSYNIPDRDHGGSNHYDISDFDFDMYTLHVGRDLGMQFLGCDLAAYLEVGFLTGDASLRFSEFDSSDNLISATTGIDVDIIPITFNLKAERVLFANIKGYISAGIGYAFTRTKFLGETDNDGGFFAQASMGLGYDINENWEIYGGARYLWLDQLDIAGSEIDNNVGYEIGLRYNF